MVDSNRTVGNVELSTVATGRTTLTDLDPAQDLLIALFKTAINNDLGPAWEEARVGTPLAASDPVQTTVPYEPDDEIFKELKVTFPALCVWREGEATEKPFTAQYDAITQQWGVDYIMGPLIVEDRRKLGGSVRHVREILKEICNVGGHAAYGMDANNVQPLQVLTNDSPGSAGFSSLRFVSGNHGPAGFGEGPPKYWAGRVILESVEYGRRTNTAQGVSHTGMRLFTGTGTGVAADDESGVDPNGIIEEQTEKISTVS